MKFLIVTLLAISLIGFSLIACGPKPASSGTSAAGIPDEMAKQVAQMPPAAREAYLRDHPEAVQLLRGQTTKP